MGDRLASRVARVVRNGNCSGCGGCAALSPRISMGLDATSGFLRPLVAESTGPESEADRSAVDQFAVVCPGVGLRAAASEDGYVDPVFGRVVSAWQGWAEDADVRFRGSSGGVLTALSAWMLDLGLASSGVCAVADPQRPSRTVAVTIRSSAEARVASGSRYAPVGNAAAYGEDGVFVGKPCEVSAARSLDAVRGVPEDDRPFKLSFFCAGTSSQRATDGLVAGMGLRPEDVVDLSYRGRGWPGRFEVSGRDGETRSMSYDESWGRHLGRQLQWRCKLCPDGTGADADIAVGDYWAADERGFPVFEERNGNSVVIARTTRGHELLMRAEREGVLHLEPVVLADVAAVQPLQVVRRRTLGVRLAARLLTGHRVPRYRGYRLWRNLLRHPLSSARQFAGTLVRSMRGR